MICRTRCGWTQTPSLAIAAYTEAIWIAVTATPLPIGTEPGSVPVHLSAGNTSPGASPCRPSPVGAPRPNLCWYSTTLSLPSRSAILIVPTFEDNARMPGMVIGVSVFCTWLSWYDTPPLTIFGPTTTVESGLISALLQRSSDDDHLVDRARVEDGLRAVVQPGRLVEFERVGGVVPGITRLGDHLTGLHVEHDGRGERGVQLGHPLAQVALHLVLEVPVDGQLTELPGRAGVSRSTPPGISLARLPSPISYVRLPSAPRRVES